MIIIERAMFFIEKNVDDRETMNRRAYAFLSEERTHFDLSEREEIHLFRIKTNTTSIVSVLRQSLLQGASIPTAVESDQEEEDWNSSRVTLSESLSESRQ
jgi:hypothetical protein